MSLAFDLGSWADAAEKCASVPYRTNEVTEAELRMMDDTSRDGLNLIMKQSLKMSSGAMATVEEEVEVDEEEDGFTKVTPFHAGSKRRQPHRADSMVPSATPATASAAKPRKFVPVVRRNAGGRIGSSSEAAAGSSPFVAHGSTVAKITHPSPVVKSISFVAALVSSAPRSVSVSEAAEPVTASAATAADSDRSDISEVAAAEVHTGRSAQDEAFAAPPASPKRARKGAPNNPVTASPSAGSTRVILPVSKPFSWATSAAAFERNAPAVAAQSVTSLEAVFTPPGALAHQPPTQPAMDVDPVTSTQQKSSMAPASAQSPSPAVASSFAGAVVANPVLFGAAGRNWADVTLAAKLGVQLPTSSETKASMDDGSSAIAVVDGAPSSLPPVKSTVVVPVPPAPAASPWTTAKPIISAPAAVKPQASATPPPSSSSAGFESLPSPQTGEVRRSSSFGSVGWASLVSNGSIGVPAVPAMTRATSMTSGSAGSVAASSVDDEERGKTPSQQQQPPAEEYELTEHRLAQRQRQIDIGKATVAYSRYIAAVPKNSRSKSAKHPVTPNIHAAVTKKAFARTVSQWRTRLHLWDDPSAPAPKADDAVERVLIADSSESVAAASTE